MGKYTTYDLKIEPKYHKDIYRIIRIDGSKTLDNLCGEILSAFNFDDNHLYMFSLKRKKFDNTLTDLLRFVIKYYRIEKTESF